VLPKLHLCVCSQVNFSCPVLSVKCFIISVPPRFANISGNRTFYANGENELILTCRTDDSNPPANISWYINGQPVASTHLTTEEVGQYGGKQTSQILALKPTRDMDGHAVECRASNSGFRDNVAIDAIVLDLMCKCFSLRFGERKKML